MPAPEDGRPSDADRFGGAGKPGHDQSSYAVRFEWGSDGVAALAPISDVVVVVDVLRFTTCVSVAVSRGATVVPFRWDDEARATQLAERLGAELAGRREDPSRRWSLSPTDLAAIPPGTTLVLPSPNGSALTVDAAEAGAGTVLAGCLRNAGAVARAAAAAGGSVAVVAAGERWPGGRLRPAIEDLLGGGAVLSGLDLDEGRGSPEAVAAAAAFTAARADLAEVLASCASGRELASIGFADDVATAAALDADAAAPTLVDGAYTAA